MQNLAHNTSFATAEWGARGIFNFFAHQRLIALYEVLLRNTMRPLPVFHYLLSRRLIKNNIKNGKTKDSNSATQIVDVEEGVEHEVCCLLFATSAR